MLTKQSSYENTKPDEMSFPVDLEQLLLEGKTIRIKPRGYSMYPLFVPGRDEAWIEKVSPEVLRWGEVVLYRREKGILVLHRIWKMNESGFYMVGDNQTEIEGPLRPNQIKGRLTGITRNGNYISVRNPVYRMLTGIWLFLRPFRPVLSKVAFHIKHRFKS